MIDRVKIDKLAHDVAMKARAQCVREAAKARVAAQDFQEAGTATIDGKEIPICRNGHSRQGWIERAEAKEAAAIEWERKARLAIRPVHELQVRDLLASLPDKVAERILNSYGCDCFSSSEQYGKPAAYERFIPEDKFVPLYNEGADYVNRRGASYQAQAAEFYAAEPNRYDDNTKES